MTGDEPRVRARRDHPLATIGTFSQPAWGFGFWATLAPGEVVRVHDPIPSIVVQSLGRPLPNWAAASLFIDHQPDFEIDLVYEAPWLSGPTLELPARFGHVRPRHRFVVCDSRLAGALAQPGALPPSDLVIAAEAATLGTLAEALAVLTTGQLLIGLDLAQIFEISGREPGTPGRGRALVVDGIGDGVVAATLRAWITTAEKHGLSGGLLLVQLVAADEHERLTLAGLDTFRPCCLTSDTDRWL